MSHFGLTLRKVSFVAAPLILGSLLFGCTGSESASNSAGTGSASSSSTPSGDPSNALKVGMVFDSGGKGDKSFNDSAYAGLEKAKAELGIDFSTVDSKSEKDYETNIASLAEGGKDVVIAVGITQANALKAVAPKFPNVKFAIVDADVTGDNVRSLLFSEEEGSYLAGFVAAGTSKTGKIGFVGGKKIPLIEKFEAGYKAGAMAANPKIVVLPSKYTESWDDTLLGKQSAASLFSEGADVVYHAAGRCGIGVITAAKEAGKFAIGVDSNQDDVAPGTVLTSMIKRVDVAVFNTLKDVKDGSFSGGSKVYNLKTDGVGLSEMKHTKDKVPADILTKLEAVKKDIVDGKVMAPTRL
jgi:basic membrane protein A and related proteins